MSKVLKRVSLFALVIVAFSAVILGGTLAKYKSTYTGTGTGDIAEWVFTVDGASEQKFTFTLASTSPEYVNGKLMPGTSGNFEITVKNESDVVDATYSIVVDTATSVMPTGMKFYTDDQMANEMTTITGNLGPNQDETSKTIKIYWQWTFEGDDENDTEFGTTKNNDLSVVLTVTGTQIDPATITPAE